MLLNIAGIVRIGRDDERAAHVERAARIEIVQIESFGAGVDFEDGARLFARGDDGFHVQVGAFARLLRIARFEVQAPGGMREDVHVRIANRAQGALRDFVVFLPQRGVQ